MGEARGPGGRVEQPVVEPAVQHVAEVRADLTLQGGEHLEPDEYQADGRERHANRSALLHPPHEDTDRYGEQRGQKAFE